MKVFTLGMFGAKTGGASGDHLGFVQIMRRNGVDVCCIPTWDTTDEPRKQAEAMGCEVRVVNPRRLIDQTDMKGATVVTFCNDRVPMVKKALLELGCRLIFAPLMCHPEAGLRMSLQAGIVDTVVYQSHYQQKQMNHRLSGRHSYGYTPEMGHVIRGYYDWESVEFNPRPHEEGTPFVIGRIARPAASKWNRNWWKMYERVPNREAILLGYSTFTRQQIGKPPKWATVHRAGSIPAADVYKQLHAFVTCNDSDEENLPRTGLEAMSCGVPLVTENRFGWTEIIENGVSGLMGNTWKEIGDLAAAISRDEARRLEIARAGRMRVESLCDPEAIWKGWKEVLGA